MPIQSTNFHNSNTLSEINNISRQGLGILDIPQPNRNILIGIDGNTPTTTANTTIASGNSYEIGNRSLTPLNTNFPQRQTTKPIQFGSNKNTTSNSNNNISLTKNTNNNTNISSSETSLTSPPANFFNSSPGQSSTPTPVLISHKFEKDDSINPQTTNIQEPTLNEVTTTVKGNKSKKKFGSLFHRNKK